MTSHTPTGRIAPPLLAWYRRHRRDLPWRGTRDPYRIWLSEIMLQQTQVATVIPYYELFLSQFPTVRSLAAAPLDDVLRRWAGLGYYSRARNLHAAAGRIVRDHGGEFPRSVDALRRLPGIGRYTAGAIASIAFGQRAAVLDGNVRRVLARLLAIRSDVSTASTQARLWDEAHRLMPARRCGDFNQALMELGATVCTPRDPACGECPLRNHCLAKKARIQHQLPVNGKRAAVRSIDFAVVAIRSGDSWLVEQRRSRGLWAGLWQLPAEEPSDGESLQACARRIVRSRLAGRSPRLPGRPARVVERFLTHRRVRFHVFPVELRRPTTPAGGATWAASDALARIGMSAAMRHVIAALQPAEAGASV